MSDPEGFLQRWSRRKLEKEPEAPRPEAANPAPEPAAKPAPDLPAEPEFDLASLPSLDEIGPGTRVDVFLQKGVPADLSRAALRRAWVSDPAIRDFVGLSENSWDFNATEGVPGFGPLEMTDELRRMVAGMFTPAPAAEDTQVAASQQVPLNETSAGDPPALANEGSRTDDDPGGQDPESKDSEVSQITNNQAGSNADVESLRQQSIEKNSPSESVKTSESIPKLTRRGHGGAMPG